MAGVRWTEKDRLRTAGDQVTTWQNQVTPNGYTIRQINVEISPGTVVVFDWLDPQPATDSSPAIPGQFVMRTV